MEGLKDRAACVRRVAVLGWAKLHNLQTISEIGRADVACACFSVFLSHCFMFDCHSISVPDNNLRGLVVSLA